MTITSLRRPAVWTTLLVILAGAWIAIPCWETVSFELTMPVIFDRQGSSITDHAVRVYRGLPIYVEPDDTYCPLLYTPLYYYLGGWTMHLLGEGIVTMRILSLTLVTGTFVVLGYLVRRLTRSWSATLLVPPLALAAYPNSGWFMDQPRVDTASSFFLILGLLPAVLGKRPWTGLLTGLCFFLAFWCKQSVALVVAGFLFLQLFTRPRPTLVAGALLAVLVPVAVFTANHVSVGWFWTFAVDTEGKDPFSPSRLVESFVADWVLVTEDGVTRPGPLLFGGLVVLPAFLLLRRRKGEAPGRERDELELGLRECLLFFASLAFYTTLSRARLGGSVKTLMPVCQLFAGLCPLALVWLTRRHGERARVVGALSLVLLVARAHFDPKDVLPDKQTEERWAQFEGVMEQFARQGQIWPTLWGYLTTPMEGQEMVPTLIELNWYFGFDDEPRYPVPPKLARAIRRQKFSAIFLPEREQPYPFFGLIQQSYRMLDGELRIRTGIERQTMKIRTFVPR